MKIITKVIRGGFWVLLTRLVIQILQFGVTIILARLLTPADFGLVAMVMVVRGFMTIFLTTGLGQGLVQKLDTNDDHLQTIFSITFVVGVILFLVAWFGAPLAASFFNNSGIILLFRISACGFLIGPFASIQQTMLSKQMRFYELSKINAASAIVSFSTTLLMAFSGFGAVSMIVGPLAGSIIAVPLCFIYFAWRPKFVFHAYAFRELFGFSWKVFATNTVEYFSRNLDNTLIGKYLGSTTLGFYNLSYNLMMLPLENIAFPLRRVLLPVFSEVQNNREQANRGYCDFLGLVATVVFPVMFGLFSVSGLFVIFAYGNQWAPAIPILQVLCIPGMLQAISIPNNSILLSIGKSGIVFILSIFGLTLYSLGFIVGLHWGVIGVSIGYAIANIIVVPISFTIVIKVAKVNLRNILTALIHPFIGSILMALVLKLIVFPEISRVINSELNLLVTMVIFGIITYLIYSMLFLSRQWRVLRTVFKTG